MCVDTVKMRLPITESNIEQIERLQKRLHNGRTIQFWFRGNFMDIGDFHYSKAVIGSKNLYLTVSFPKVLFGNNIDNLTPEQTGEVINILQEELQLNISEAVVTKLHIAQTIEVDYKPQMYFEYLGEYPHRHRWNCTATTLYYNTQGKKKWKQFYCYDKGKESVNKITPESVFFNKNLFRLELRLEKNPAYYLKKERYAVKVKDLADADLQQEFMTLLVDEYNAIHKCRPIVDIVALSKTSTPKEALDYFFVEMLQAAIIDDIAFKEKFHTLTTKFAGFKTGESFRRVRPMLDKMIERYAVQGRYALEEELTAKVNALLKCE